VAAIFVGGLSSGITMTARLPSSRAASATACAWFPDEYAATPFFSRSGGSWETAL
jgi:hypothetical protein